MKKLLVFILILITASVHAQNTYLRTGISLFTKKATISEKVAFGGVAGHTNFGVVAESKPADKRHWYLGAELAQDIPLSETIDFRMGLEGKVDLTYKSHKDLYVEPQGGFNFHISKSLGFLMVYGAEFAAPYYNLKDARGNVDLGLFFKF